MANNSMYGSLARPPGGPPSDCLNDDSTTIPKHFPPFLIAIIDRFSKKEWAPEGAYGVILVKIAGFPSVKRVLQ